MMIAGVVATGFWVIFGLGALAALIVVAILRGTTK